MYTTITVKQILDRKGYDVWSVDSNVTIFEALRVMANKNIGALLVIEDHKTVGIFSERDYARRLVLKGRNEQDTRVKEVMTDYVLGIRLNQKIVDCLALMTEKHIRHLPVIDEGNQVVGVISIGDVVKELSAEQTFIIDQLVQYVTGESRKPPIPEKLEVDI